jgi:hypothetical protein
MAVGVLQRSLTALSSGPSDSTRSPPRFTLASDELQRSRASATSSAVPASTHLGALFGQHATHGRPHASRVDHLWCGQDRHVQNCRQVQASPGRASIERLTPRPSSHTSSA